MCFGVSPSPGPSLCLYSLSLPSFSFLLLTHHSPSPSLSCSLPLQLSLLSVAGATPLILPAAAWWRTVTDRVALPLYPAALKRWYIHLQGLITTWHVPHLQQTLSWQQSTKRTIGCALINKWNKYNSTSKDRRENTHQWLYQFSHSWGHKMRSKVTSCFRVWGNMNLRPDLNERWSHWCSQIFLPIIFIFCQHLETRMNSICMIGVKINMRALSVWASWKRMNKINSAKWNKLKHHCLGKRYMLRAFYQDIVIYSKFQHLHQINRIQFSFYKH